MSEEEEENTAKLKIGDGNLLLQKRFEENHPRLSLSRFNMVYVAHRMQVISY
ncbi:hypothetical protein MTR_3g048450 [Medicago truncatula]|uniref:Uncharacterized protein n=1 Tax=Medicago truncatula TaxID=3880 RepID=G7IZV4_MEDTR|nr:hypothetical protein MTR_3g048450 [Medicago truncatula]